MYGKPMLLYLRGTLYRTHIKYYGKYRERNGRNVRAKKGSFWQSQNLCYLKEGFRAFVCYLVFDTFSPPTFSDSAIPSGGCGKKNFMRIKKETHRTYLLVEKERWKKDDSNV